MPMLPFRDFTVNGFRGLRSLEVTELRAINENLGALGSKLGLWVSPGSAYPEGWEHAEFVADVPLATLVEAHPQLPWELDDLHKTLNPDLRLRYAGFSVKFHERSLEAVIAGEQGSRPERA